MIEFIKHLLKKIVPLVVLTKFFRKYRRSVLIDPMVSLYSHYPQSAGNQKILSKIALNSAFKYESSLNELYLKINDKSLNPIINAEALITNKRGDALASEIGLMLEMMGSDKSTKNNYHLIYGYIFEKYNIRSLIEVGIGSNNESIPSNMGKKGIPGASIKAFSKFVSESVIGLDYDKSILFQDKNIYTYFVDQLSKKTFDELPSFNNIDLAIDDGLHVQSANINTLSYFIDKISESGVIVIEDIPLRAIDSWIIINEILRSKYLVKIIRCKKSYAILIESKK
jgi:hypothetical protein